MDAISTAYTDLRMKSSKDRNGKSSLTGALPQKIKNYYTKEQATFPTAPLTRVSSWEAKIKITQLKAGKLERSSTSPSQRQRSSLDQQKKCSLEQNGLHQVGLLQSGLNFLIL